MKKKILLTFTIIISAVLLAGIFVYAKDHWLWQTYRNEQYGFQLQMPPTWKTVNIYTVEDSPQETSFAFQFPLKNPSREDNGTYTTYGEFLVIGVLPKFEWQKMQNEEGPKPQYLTERDERVFHWSIGNGGWEFKDIDYDQVIFKDVPKVLKTFKTSSVDDLYEDISKKEWKKFKSAHLGYVAYYPPIWFAKSSQYDETDDFINEESSAPLAMSEKGVWVTISALSKKNQTLDEVIQIFRKENLTEQRYEIVSQEALIIGTQKALRLHEKYLPTAPDSEGLSFVVFYIDYGDIVYRASILYGNEEAYKNNEAIIRQILATIERK